MMLAKLDLDVDNTNINSLSYLINTCIELFFKMDAIYSIIKCPNGAIKNTKSNLIYLINNESYEGIYNICLNTHVDCILTKDYNIKQTIKNILTNYVYDNFNEDNVIVMSMIKQSPVYKCFFKLFTFIRQYIHNNDNICNTIRLTWNIHDTDTICFNICCQYQVDI